MRASCLIVYGPSVIDPYVRAAYFVDRILKGAKPTGRLLVSALGFAGCSMPSYNRSLWRGVHG